MSKQSKHLSLILRHNPDNINVNMDRNGWVDIDHLISKATIRLTKKDIMNAVDTDAKGRFALSKNNRKIRALQGHSIDVDLELATIQPPEYLYHGTSTRTLDKIFFDGIKKMNRNHVHLSESVEMAKSVGSRHGSPVVLKVKAKEMSDHGHQFFKSENGVWLTKSISTIYISSAY